MSCALVVKGQSAGFHAEPEPSSVGGVDAFHVAGWLSFCRRFQRKYVVFARSGVEFQYSVLNCCHEDVSVHVGNNVAAELVFRVVLERVVVFVIDADAVSAAGPNLFRQRLFYDVVYYLESVASGVV